FPESCRDDDGAWNLAISTLGDHLRYRGSGGYNYREIHRARNITDRVKTVNIQHFRPSRVDREHLSLKGPIDQVPEDRTPDTTNGLRGTDHRHRSRGEYGVKGNARLGPAYRRSFERKRRRFGHHEYTRNGETSMINRDLRRQMPERRRLRA